MHGNTKKGWYSSSQRQDKYVPIRHQVGGEGCKFPVGHTKSITFMKSLQKFVDIMDCCSDDATQGTTPDEDYESDYSIDDDFY